MTNKVVIFISCLLLATSPSFVDAAQEAIPNFQFYLLGARHQALGGSVPSIQGDINGVLTNPAAIASSEILQGSTIHNKLYNQIDYFGVNGSFPFRNFRLGIGLGSISLQDIPETAIVDSRIRQLSTYGSGFRVFYSAIARSYARKFGLDLISIGINPKLYQQYVDTDTRWGYGFDAGIMATKTLQNSFIQKLHFGFSGINIFSKAQDWPGTNGSGEFESDFLVGLRAATRHDRWSFYLQNHWDEAVSISTEYRFPQRIILRGSTDFNRYHMGVGIVLSNLANWDYQTMDMRIDYTYSVFTEVGEVPASHTIGFSLFGGSNQVKPVITKPSKSTLTSKNTIALAGVGQPHSRIMIYNNNILAKSVPADHRGKWKTNKFKLRDGANKLTVKSYTIEKNYSQASNPVTIHSDQTKPSIKVDLVPKGNLLKFNLIASEPLSSVAAKLDNKDIRFNRRSNTHWEVTMPFPENLRDQAPVPDEQHTLTLSVKDKAGNPSDEISIPLLISVTYPKNKAATYEEHLTILGTLSPTVKQLWINGAPVPSTTKQKFAKGVRLHTGKNILHYKLILQNNEIINYYGQVLKLKTYTDIKGPYSDRQEMEWLATLGILKGDPDGLYRPEKTYTRLTFAKFLVFNEKLELPQSLTQHLYKDVKRTDSYAPYVFAVVKKGWMRGLQGGVFSPSKAMTVGNASQILENAGLLDAANVDPTDQSTLTKKKLAKLLVYSPKYRVQILKLTTWD